MPDIKSTVEAMEVDIKVEEVNGEDEEEELPPKVIPTFLKDEEDKLSLLTSYKYNMFVHDNILDFTHRAFIFKARKVFEAKLEKLCRIRTKDEIQRKKKGLKKDAEKEEDRKKELFDLYVQLGHIHLLVADFPKSMFAYQHAYKYDTAKFRSNPPALFGLGLVYFHFKAHAACIEAFNHYLYCEKGGEVAKEVHVRLGIVHKICGDFEKSRKHFSCALDDLQKTPLFTESEIRFHIAHCYDAEGDSKSAIEEYTKLKNDSLVQQDKRLLANVYRALGWVSFRTEPIKPENRIQNLKEAEIYLKEAQKLDDQNSRSFYYLGRFYSELPNQANIAFINYRASIDKNEHDADTWCSIGVLYKIQSQDLDALQAFVCAVQINPTHSAAWTNLGKLYEHHCFYRDANYCYKKAVTNNSPNPEPLKRRIQVLEKAIKENPHLFLKPLPLNYKPTQNSLHPLEQAWYLGIPAELLPHQKEIAKYHRYLYRLGSPLTKMSELAAAYSNRQPLGELNPTQMEILKILQINKDHLESTERSLLQHLEQRFRQTDKRHGHQQQQQSQAAETTVSNEVAANSNLSKDLLEDPMMKPFPFLPSNDLDNLMAQALKDDPSTSNMGNYLEGNDGMVVAAENRSTPPIKSGELPTNFSLLSALHVPITITANEVLSKCQQRLTNPEAFTPIFDETCPPPRPHVIPLKQRPAMDKLGLKTPLIKVEKPSEAHSLELQNFCYKSPIALIRGLTTALKMDLSLFSTKSMTETQPDYSVEVRTQYRMPGDINVDQLGQPSWTCYSTRSYTNIGRYGVYQAESFRHSLKEETERLRAAGTGSKYAIAAAKAQAEGTPLGTIATTAPVASLLSLSNTATNTRESSSTPTPTSSTAPPPTKRRRTAGAAGNQASVNASAAKLAAAANLCGPDDLPTGHMPMKVVKFGTNVDLSDETKFPLQLKELNKMPAFTRNAAGACNLLSHLGHSVFGMNTVQMYMKVPGCRTPGHLENNCFASVNINIGPGECEWFGVDYEYWPVVNKMCNDRKMDLMKDSWWPNFEDLIKARVPVYRFTQKAGDLVWVGGGCVHWVQAIGWCNNVAWNVGPMTSEQLEMSLYAYEWNKLTNYRSLVPMQHLCWQLAVNVRFTNQKFFNVVKGVLIRSLSFCRMIYDYIETRTKNPIKYQPRIKGEASHYCHNCDIEVFNMLFVKEHHNKFRVFCVHCAKKTEFEEYVVLQQTSFDDLSKIFDRLQLHPMEPISPSRRNVWRGCRSHISPEPSTSCLNLSRDRRSNASPGSESSISRHNTSRGRRSEASPAGNEALIKNDRRYNVCMEMLTTEQNYVEDLELLIKLYKDPLDRLTSGPSTAEQPTSPAPSKMILNKQQINSIFGKIQPILNIHRVILSSLETFMTKWNSTYDDITFGYVWAIHGVELSKVYPPYVNDYDSVRETLDDCLENIPKFLAFVKAAEADPKCRKRTVKDLLIKPVQRLPSVSLLLEEIRKRTDKSHKDHELLATAIKGIEKVLQKTNNSRKEIESYDNIITVCNQIEGYPPELISSHRLFHRTVELAILGGDGFFNNYNGRSMTIFLFNDFAVFTKTRSSGGGNSPNSINQSFYASSSRSSLYLPTRGTLSRKVSFLGQKIKERKPYKLISMHRISDFRVIRYEFLNEVIIIKVRNEESEYLFIGQPAGDTTFNDLLEFFKLLCNLSLQYCKKELRMEELTEDLIKRYKNSGNEDFAVIDRAITFAKHRGGSLKRQSTLRRTLSNVSLGISTGLQRFASKAHLSFINETSL